MSFVISEEDVVAYCTGALLLASGGGGGAPYENMVLMKRNLRLYGEGHVISCDELKDDDYVILFGYVGAGVIARELLPSRRSIEKLVDALEKSIQKTCRAFCVVAIGASASVFPLAWSSLLKKELVDADLMGRTFANLSCISLKVHGQKPMEYFFSDLFGNILSLRASSFDFVERYARNLSRAMGLYVPFVFALSGDEVKKYTLKGTVSKAFSIGKTLLNAPKDDFITPLLKVTHGRYIGYGTVIDIDHRINSGFFQGKIMIQGDDQSWCIRIQNEFISVEDDNGRCLVQMPDIISLLDADGGGPLVAATVFFGARVHIVTIPTDPIWYTKEGMKIIDPHSFLFKG